jgi:hypothetical protein
LPATSIHQVCPPFLFPSAVRDGAPQTLTYLLTSISFAKIIGCPCVHPCPLLGPPLISRRPYIFVFFCKYRSFGCMIETLEDTAVVLSELASDFFSFLGKLASELIGPFYSRCLCPS